MPSQTTVAQKRTKVIKKATTKREVRKHNYLVEAYYKATKQEQRIFHWAAAEVDATRPNQNIFRIPLNELMKVAGVTNRSIYDEVEQITDRLRSRKIDIRDLNKNRFLQTNLVASVEYDRANRMVDVEISKKMIPYLATLKQYTRINLELFFSLSSGYAMRIYELMKQYERIGVRVIPIVELRRYLGITDKKSYDRFNNINFRILKPSFEEKNLI